jgi:hypothetical protein
MSGRMVYAVWFLWLICGLSFIFGLSLFFGKGLFIMDAINRMAGYDEPMQEKSHYQFKGLQIIGYSILIFVMCYSAVLEIGWLNKVMLGVLIVYACITHYYEVKKFI